MTINNRWLLPEGVEEILPPKAMQLEHLCRTIIDLLSTWGYEFVIPPMIEYLESLLTGTGEDLDLKTFKLTDQLSGRLMGIRADMTPQVARIDAHLLKRDTPTRLCYLGSVLHTRPGKSGETRSPLQLGAELYGHAGVASDIEIVKLMLSTLRHVGINQTYIDLGHIGVFRALSTESTLNDEQQSAVFEALQRKAKDELKSLYKDWNINDDASKALLDLVDLNGDVSVLNEAEKLFNKISSEVTNYIKEIKALADSIKNESDITINIDLAELRGYHYHTGMVYTAFVPGKGEGIAFGGRYDDIGSAFGRARPATGFSLDVKSLLQFQNIEKPVAKRIFAPASDEVSLQRKINELRNSGETVVQELAGQQATASQMDCDQELVPGNGEWDLKEIK
ncbi:MAG: ATP phosphoribosyltransferase regulatory subunit [Proteobacteria bacterium]|nr:ATP phosphoribosyltransferase regulatory subunit [Pseudomonadota bacterium]NOG58994.1 ATP phosphoribosyltransferase regulatory subunit [Pseudomonadota bacterium]